MMGAPVPPRGRTATNACVDDVIRNLGNVGTYLAAQVAAGRPMNTVLGIQTDAVHPPLQNRGAVDM